MSAGGLLSGGGRVLAVPARPRLFPRPRPLALWPSQFAFVAVPAPRTRRLFLLFSGGKKGNNHERTFVAIEGEE